MSLEGAFTTIRTAINADSTLPECFLRWRHPDDPAITYPWSSLEMSDEERTDSDVNWIITNDLTARLDYYLYVSSASDNIALEVIRMRQALISVIKAANLANHGTSSFKCRVARVEVQHPANVKYAAIRATIEVGSYE